MTGQLGLSSYTYVWRCGVPGYPAPPFTPFDLLDTARSLGVPVLQIADNLPVEALAPEEQDRLAAAARCCGITLELGTRGVRPDHLERYLDLAARLGVRFMRTMLDAAEHKPDEREAVRLLRESAPQFERAGVTLGVENHDRFRSPVLRRIVEDVGSAHVGICLDTANSTGCGEGPEQTAAVLLDLTVNLHVKDFTARRLPHGKGFLIEGAPAGKGLVDIPALLAAAGRLPRTINVILEQWPPPEAAVEDSIRKEAAWAAAGVEYLRGCLAKNETHVQR